MRERSSVHRLHERLSMLKDRHSKTLAPRAACVPSLPRQALLRYTRHDLDVTTLYSPHMLIVQFSRSIACPHILLLLALLLLLFLLLLRPPPAPRVVPTSCLFFAPTYSHDAKSLRAETHASPLKRKSLGSRVSILSSKIRSWKSTRVL